MVFAGLNGGSKDCCILNCISRRYVLTNVPGLAAVPKISYGGRRKDARLLPGPYPGSSLPPQVMRRTGRDRYSGQDFNRH